jgi:hypothetical protein
MAVGEVTSSSHIEPATVFATALPFESLVLNAVSLDPKELPLNAIEQIKSPKEREEMGLERNGTWRF